LNEIDTYKEAILKDKDHTDKYFINCDKSEQQKLLEKFLSQLDISKNSKISDLGCGGGKLAYYLNKIYPDNDYYLLDYNKDAIDIAKGLNPQENMNFSIDNIYHMKYDDNYFDVTTCLNVVSFLEDTKKALDEIVRVTKKGGDIFISALINFDHDVDLSTKVLDHTRNSAKDNLYYTYNTFSKNTITNWLDNKVSSISFHEFSISKDLEYKGRGIDTYTIDTEEKKLQVAGGMLLNWGFIHVVK
jgi:ubiquinone/menaquinone biosynthesis C-methylase UbiE